MRVAVTGSTGLIGRALVERLASDGHQTVRVVRAAGGPGQQGSTVNWNPEADQIEGRGLGGP